MRKIKKINNLLTFLLIGVAVITAIPFFEEAVEDIKEDKKQEEVVRQIEEIVSDKPDEESKVVRLKKKYSDVVGYVYIPGTSISYPVMQTKEEPDYYLYRDINKNYSSYGTPYLSAYCDVQSSDQLIIYGHNMGKDKMFGVLSNYKDEEYLEEHPVIIFETEGKKCEYEIFAVMSVNVYDFQYWKFTIARNEEEYFEFVDMVMDNNILKIAETPVPGEQMITLSTCDNGKGKDWRIVVIASKRVGR